MTKQKIIEKENEFVLSAENIALVSMAYNNAVAAKECFKMARTDACKIEILRQYLDRIETILGDIEWDVRPKTKLNFNLKERSKMLLKRIPFEIGRKEA